MVPFKMYIVEFRKSGYYTMRTSLFGQRLKKLMKGIIYILIIVSTFEKKLLQNYFS